MQVFFLLYLNQSFKMNLETLVTNCSLKEYYALHMSKKIKNTLFNVWFLRENVSILFKLKN